MNLCPRDFYSNHVNPLMLSLDWAPIQGDAFIDWSSDAECKPIYVNGMKLALGGSRSYKLCQVKPDWAPVLVIDGIIMHTLKMNPLLYAEGKIKPIKVMGKTVLECCSGLGYVTLALLSHGARRVITVEADPNVILLSRYNKYSRSFMDPRVDLLLSDMLIALKRFRDSAFDVVIHDPPTLKRDTGELFSANIYGEYSRVLKRNGVMYHYLPHPGEKYRGRDIRRGIINRMRMAGLRIVKETEDGLYAEKASR